MVQDFPRRVGTSLAGEVFPVFVVETGQTSQIVSAAGTGFLIAPGLLVTCWHCVREGRPENRHYVAVTHAIDDARGVAVLRNIEQVKDRDFAFAEVDLTPEVPLGLATEGPAYGEDVFTFGYPLVQQERSDLEDEVRFRLTARYFEGYVTSEIWHEDPVFGRVPAYELDMPAPAGISGAPLIRRRTTDVVGVIFGSREIATIDQFASVDTETGERIPEVQKLVSFGLAHNLETLHDAAGSATDDTRLGDLIARAE